MITEAVPGDVPEIVAVAAARRREFSGVQPQFAREAEGALEAHTQYLGSLVADPEVTALVAREDSRIVGYLFASLTDAPPIYDPGGRTGYVDDFAVAEREQWGSVGRDLLVVARKTLADRGAVQVVVVCGAHQREKREALTASGLAPVSEWWVSPLSGTNPASG